MRSSAPVMTAPRARRTGGASRTTGRWHVIDVAQTESTNLPPCRELVEPAVRALGGLGGTAEGWRIRAKVLADIGVTPNQLAVRYRRGRPRRVLIDRIEWALTYSKLAGLLIQPSAGWYSLTPLGAQLLRLPRSEAADAILRAIRAVRAGRLKSAECGEVDDGQGPTADEAARIQRLYGMHPSGFERYVLDVLRATGLILQKTGRPGDEGIDGLGFVPIHPVIGLPLAVQAKRDRPTHVVSRASVALFQRDAATAGAMQGIYVSLGNFSRAAQRASSHGPLRIALIDGPGLCRLARRFPPA